MTLLMDPYKHKKTKINKIIKLRLGFQTKLTQFHTVSNL